MRTLLAIAVLVGGILALDTPADAGRKNKRGDNAAERNERLRERLLCEERARHEDAGRYYTGFPCWAREAFGRGSRGGVGRE